MPKEKPQGIVTPPIKVVKTPPKKKRNRKPSIKAKLTASKLVENGGNIGKAMIAAGYSKATAKTPQKLTESKGWKTLTDKYLSDEILTKKHSELLGSSAVRHYVFPVSLTDKEIIDIVLRAPGAIFVTIKRNQTSAYAYFTVPDNATQTKNLELAYKVRGKLKSGEDPGEGQGTEEIREVILRIRKILPSAGQ